MVSWFKASFGSLVCIVGLLGWLNSIKSRNILHQFRCFNLGTNLGGSKQPKRDKGVPRLGVGYLKQLQDYCRPSTSPTVVRIVKFLRFCAQIYCFDPPLRPLRQALVSSSPPCSSVSGACTERSECVVKIGFDFLRVSVPPWWVLVFGYGLRHAVATVSTSSTKKP